MNISFKYQLAALLELAAVFPGTLTVAEIARRRDIPRPFLGRLLADLARENVVATTRGARGGVRLAHPPGEVRLAALLSGENAQPPSTPVVQWLAARLSAARREALNGVTLAQLVQIERLQSAGLDFEI